MSMSAEVTVMCEACGTSVIVDVPVLDEHVVSHASMAVREHGWGGALGSDGLSVVDMCGPCRAAYWAERRRRRTEAERIFHGRRESSDWSGDVDRLIEILRGDDETEARKAARFLLMTVHHSDPRCPAIYEGCTRFADEHGIRRELKRRGVES